MSVWCGPCRQSFPFMNAMQDKYAGAGLVIALAYTAALGRVARGPPGPQPEPLLRVRTGCPVCAREGISDFATLVPKSYRTPSGSSVLWYC